LWYAKCQDLVKNALVLILVFQEITTVLIHQEESPCRDYIKEILTISFFIAIINSYKIIV